jgi:hypothetical protein
MPDKYATKMEAQKLHYKISDLQKAHKEKPHPVTRMGF